jgi:hypothetical protein
MTTRVRNGRTRIHKSIYIRSQTARSYSLPHLPDRMMLSNITSASFTAEERQKQVNGSACYLE